MFARLRKLRGWFDDKIGIFKIPNWKSILKLFFYAMLNKFPSASHIALKKEPSLVNLVTS